MNQKYNEMAKAEVIEFLADKSDDALVRFLEKDSGRVARKLIDHKDGSSVFPPNPEQFELLEYAKAAASHIMIERFFLVQDAIRENAESPDPLEFESDKDERIFSEAMIDYEVRRLIEVSVFPEGNPTESDPLSWGGDDTFYCIISRLEKAIASTNKPILQHQIDRLRKGGKGRTETATRYIHLCLANSIIKQFECHYETQNRRAA